MSVQVTSVEEQETVVVTALVVTRRTGRSDHLRLSTVKSQVWFKNCLAVMITIAAVQIGISYPWRV